MGRSVWETVRGTVRAGCSLLVLIKPQKNKDTQGKEGKDSMLVVEFPFPESGVVSPPQGCFPQASCSPCLPGHYCGSSGLIHPSGPCSEGFFCLRGAITPNRSLEDRTGGPCPAGMSWCKGSKGGTWEGEEGQRLQHQAKAQCLLLLPADGSQGPGRLTAVPQVHSTKEK